MLDRFVEIAHERGWSIQLEQAGKRPDREGELLSRGREHVVDGDPQPPQPPPRR